jgi:hypothetical protein
MNSSVLKLFFLCQFITDSSHSICELPRKKFYYISSKSQCHKTFFFVTLAFTAAIVITSDQEKSVMTLAHQFNVMKPFSLSLDHNTAGIKH